MAVSRSASQNVSAHSAPTPLLNVASEHEVLAQRSDRAVIAQRRDLGWSNSAELVGGVLGGRNHLSLAPAGDKQALRSRVPDGLVVLLDASRPSARTVL